MNKREERLLREVLAEGRRDRFGPGFADRAAERWRTSRAQGPPLGRAVARQFGRLVPVAAAAALLLAVHNVRLRERSAGQSVVEALFGLPPAAHANAVRATGAATAAAAAAAPASTITLDQLYGLDSVAPSGGE